MLPGALTEALSGATSTLSPNPVVSMNLATPRARLIAALTLVTLGLAGPAAAQCVKSQSNLTIELLLDGRNTGGTFTYVWDVTYDPATP